MIQQVEITLTPKSRGFHLVTNEILRQLPKLPKLTLQELEALYYDMSTKNYINEV